MGVSRGSCASGFPFRFVSAAWPVFAVQIVAALTLEVRDQLFEVDVPSCRECSALDDGEFSA
jgi:hypothetical protein